ncbi:hypothetical protein F4818DRAFT_441777 [Hypoxylon cercidicola]|nr:hypothetical protein F4818DRAFT_441777 [Hypoxylon cercidicola]
MALNAFAAFLDDVFGIASIPSNNPLLDEARAQRPESVKNLTYRDLGKANQVFRGNHAGVNPGALNALRMSFSGVAPAYLYNEQASQVGVILCGNVHIQIDIEMLRPLKLLYRQFVSTHGFRRMIEVSHNELDGWKIVLTALYAADEFLSLDDRMYDGPDYVKAMVLLAAYQAEKWVRQVVASYFKTYCYRLRMRAHAALYEYGPLAGPDHDMRLLEMQACADLYRTLHPPRFIGIPQWAFGYWALRTIPLHYVWERLRDLSEPFNEDILKAMRVVSQFREDGIEVDETVIFLVA